MKRISGKNTTTHRSLIVGATGVDNSDPAILTLIRRRRLVDIGWLTEEIEPVEPEFDEDGLGGLVDEIAAASGDCVDPEA